MIGGRSQPGRVVARVGQVQAATGLHDVADHQADEQRERGHQQEVGQGHTAHLADSRRVSDRADAQHDGAEDHRSDHHLDQCNERGTQGLQRDREVRDDQTEQGSDDHTGDHENVEVVGPVFLGLTLRPTGHGLR